MAPSSSSAKKVAKLASRGKGKKVRFSGGTTFPAVVASASVAMLGLITYAKLSVPDEAVGPPEAGVTWVSAYEFRVCDSTFTIEGQPADAPPEGETGASGLDMSAGDISVLRGGASSAAGFINVHPQVGGNSGKKATLGVWLNTYDIGLSKDGLTIPADQSDSGTEPDVYDVDDAGIFEGTSCEGKTPTVVLRVWEDASANSFQDKITDFGSQRFTASGMAWVIAIVPDDDSVEITKPASTSQLDEFTATAEPEDTVVTEDTTPTEDTTADTAPVDSAPADTVGDTTTTG